MDEARYNQYYIIYGTIIGTMKLGNVGVRVVGARWALIRINCNWVKINIQLNTSLSVDIVARAANKPHLYIVFYMQYLYRPCTLYCMYCAFIIIPAVQKMADRDEGLVSELFSGKNSSESGGWCYDYNRCHFQYVSLMLLKIINICISSSLQTANCALPKPLVPQSC